MRPLREMTDEMTEADFDSEAPDTALDRRKRSDLLRARARSVFRPIKKELRHSQIEGRYIRPAELQKEVEKLEKAKQEAERKKKGFFYRLFHGSEKTPVAEEKKPAETNGKNNETATDGLSDEERKRKALQIRKLRGIALKSLWRSRAATSRLASSKSSIEISERFIMLMLLNFDR